MSSKIYWFTTKRSINKPPQANEGQLTLTLHHPAHAAYVVRCEIGFVWRNTQDQHVDPLKKDAFPLIDPELEKLAH